MLDNACSLNLSGCLSSSPATLIACACTISTWLDPARLGFWLGELPTQGACNIDPLKVSLRERRRKQDHSHAGRSNVSWPLPTLCWNGAEARIWQTAGSSAMRAATQSDQPGLLT
eukprot:3226808-Amphidinium_carterae.2